MDHQSRINNTKIVLTGGGTGGSVTPLLALADNLKKAGYGLAWIGTYQGIEKRLVADNNIAYHPIASGKLRRYFSIQNIIDPFLIIIGFFQALILLIRLRPGLVITAGSFVSVPVVWAAGLLGIKSIVHQQDIRPGLANKLMAPFAKIVTVTFQKSLQDFKKKAVWVGNPIRHEFADALQKNRKADNGLPGVLVLGGGMGAAGINQLLIDALPNLKDRCEIIHISGYHTKALAMPSAPHYHHYSFLDADKLADAMHKADLIVSRAGIGTITELSYLGKPSIIIPMPDSHQEDNAAYIKEKGAAIVMDQKELTSEALASQIKRLLENQLGRETLGNHMKALIQKDGGEEMVRVVGELEA